MDQSGPLSGASAFGDIASAAPKVMDNLYGTSYDSSASSCFVGIDFGEDF